MRGETEYGHYSARSMTGFAGVQGASGDWRWSLDLRSVNGRGLDLRLRVPDWIPGLEQAARKRLQDRLARGNVSLSLRVSRDAATTAVGLNEAALDAALSLVAAVSGRAQSAGVALRKPSAVDIAGMRGVTDQPEVGEEDLSTLTAAILADLDRAVALLDADRAREGEALATVLAEQVDAIESLVGAAVEAAGDRTEEMRLAIGRALDRLREATETLDEGRVAQELALIAVKTDVTEELDRLAAHVEAARGLLAEDGPVGRRLDFLAQEFNREANTLCSKAQNRELTAVGLELKAAIDQMREQIQNLE